MEEVYYRKLYQDQFDFMKGFTGTNSILVQYKEYKNINNCKLNNLITSIKAKLPLYRDLCCKIDSTLVEKGKFNTWQGFVSKKLEINNEAIHKIQPMLDFIREVIANNQEDRYQYLLKWMSYTVSTNQKTFGKGTSFIWRTKNRKNFLGRILAYYVIGRNVCAFLDSISAITEKFNSPLEGTRLDYVKEIASTKEEFRPVFEKIKTWITDEINYSKKIF